MKKLLDKPAIEDQLPKKIVEKLQSLFETRHRISVLQEFYNELLRTIRDMVESYQKGEEE